MKKIAQGAEAIIYQEKDVVIKDRFSKKYRLKALDESLRKTRTRREAKIIEKLPVKGPKLLEIDEGKAQLKMSYIKGDKLRDVFALTHCKQIGKSIATMHNEQIIHGDLTTSNMIVKDEEVYFIDFGLSFFSTKPEDKAVDLHLLRQALESKHYKIWEKAYKQIIEEYQKNAKDAKLTIERLKLVEERGRNKHK